MGMVHIKTNQSFTPVAGRKYKLLLGSGGSGGGGGSTYGQNDRYGHGGVGGNGNELPFQWIAPDNTPIACTIGQGGAGGAAAVTGGNWIAGSGAVGGTTSFGSIVSVSGPRGGTQGTMAAIIAAPSSNFGVKVTVGGNGGMSGAGGGNVATAGGAGTAGGIFIAWDD